MFMMTQEQQVNDAFDEWQSFMDGGDPFQAPPAQSGSGISLGFPTSLKSFSINNKEMAKTIIGTHRLTLNSTPKISTVQTIFENSLIPKLNDALTKLDYIDDFPEFVFTITPKMQGDLMADPLEMDLTEIYALQVSLNMLKVVVDMAVAYNLDFTSYDSLGIMEALNPGSDFLKVRNGGQSLTDAKSSLLTAVDKLELGIDFLRNEVDSQDDDIIKLDPGSSDDADLDSILAYTDEAREFLTDGLSFTEDWDDNEDTPDEALTVNLGEYFDSPIQDLKSLLPEYSISVGRDTSYDDYNWNYGQSYVSTTVDGGDGGFYYYYRSYSWDQYGFEYAYEDSNIAIPAFEIVFKNKISELRQIEGIESMYISLYWSNTLSSGQNNIGETMYWDYYTRESASIMYFPILTWTAETFDEWVLPDPTFGGILPGMTDSEFKRIFGITEDHWEDIGGN
jgi:hypothetical protein